MQDAQYLSDKNKMKLKTNTEDLKKEKERKKELEKKKREYKINLDDLSEQENDYHKILEEIYKATED